MIATVSKDQTECLYVLDALGINPDDIRPIPPRKTCDCAAKLEEGMHIIISRTIGEGFTIYILEEATDAQAWEMYKKIRGESPMMNPRLVHTTADAAFNPATN